MSVTSFMLRGSKLALFLLLAGATVKAQTFTTANGYKNGSLNGQNSWTGSSTNFQVDIATGQVRVNTSQKGYSLATQSANGVALGVGVTASASADFVFTQKSNNPKADAIFFGIDLYPGGAFSVLDSVQRNANGSYSTGIWQINNGTNGSFAGAEFSPESVGIHPESGKNTSDVLRLIGTVTYGTSNTNWVTSVSVYDVTTSKTLGSATATFATTPAIYESGQGTNSWDHWIGRLTSRMIENANMDAILINSYNGIQLVPEKK